MNITFFGKYQLTTNIYASIKKVQLRRGICSNDFNTDKHMLLWDFDEIEYTIIINELQRLQKKYELPTIYVLKSSENHYHAYCFASREFKEIIHILSDTNSIDLMYLRLGVARGYYTLRYSPKNNNAVTIVAVLKSWYENEITPLDITLNEYFTTNI